MKFENQIKKVLDTLQEEMAPVQAGQPQASNPAQVAPQAQQQVQQQGQAQQGQQQPLNADQVMQFALSLNPNELKGMGIDPSKSGEELFQSVANAYMTKNVGNQPNAKPNQQAASNNQQNTSSQPAGTNTSGIQGTTSTQV